MDLSQSTVRQTEMGRVVSGNTGRLIVTLWHGVWLEFHCKEEFGVSLVLKEERDAQKSYNPRQKAMGRIGWGRVLLGNAGSLPVSLCHVSLPVSSEFLWKYLFLFNVWKSFVYINFCTPKHAVPIDG